MATDLLPCPWCGAPGDTTIVDHLGARCTACGAMGPMRDVDGESVHMHPERARSAWNRRAPPLAAPAPSAMATGEDERMGARPSWETMHTPMGPSGGGSWDDARRRWAAEASARATPPAAPTAVTQDELMRMVEWIDRLARLGGADTYDARCEDCARTGDQPTAGFRCARHLARALAAAASAERGAT